MIEFVSSHIVPARKAIRLTSYSDRKIDLLAHIRGAKSDQISSPI